MVDKALILRKISDLAIYKNQLAEYSALSLDAYKADWKTQRIIERTLQMMIETCSDIANHIISDTGMRTPTSYADGFKVLFENKVIDSELFNVMDKMAKFRNVVVHQYEQVDAEIVITILRKHLVDFERFESAIVTFLKSI